MLTKIAIDPNCRWDSKVIAQRAHADGPLVVGVKVLAYDPRSGASWGAFVTDLPTNAYFCSLVTLEIEWEGIDILAQQLQALYNDYPGGL